MTRSHINRRTATVLTAAIALGAAGPAAARPIGDDGPVQVAPPMTAQHYDNASVPVPRHMQAFPAATLAPVTATSRAVVNHPGPGGSSDLVYILVGGLVVALGGLGSTLAVANRRRTVAPRARIAA
ncbi:MAG TPA: hypothetical protein VHW96_07480 [Solirubrobacteraceae bacterium]|nr:hypothetical protein [Solirubrobacteraceae bacterium]